MSIVSNVHQFAPLTKDSKALSGQRLVRLIAKANKDGSYPSPHLTKSLCVSVPVVGQDDVVSVIDQLIPHVIGMVKDAQDSIIREWRIEYGREEIPESEFSINQVVAYLDENAAGDRVSSEYLQEWFTDLYATIAAEWISAQLKVDSSAAVVAQKVTVLRDMFAGFSSPKYSPPIPKLKAMIRFCQVAGDSADSRLSGYHDKCASLLRKKEAELSDNSLGF